MQIKGTKRIRKVLFGENGLVIVLIGMFVLFSFITPNFLDLTNMFNVSRQIASLGICSVGMTIVMVSGGIDLSLGFQISLVNVVCAKLMVDYSWPPILAILVVIFMGTSLGILNGIIVVKSGVASLIVTLAMMNILKGASYLISRGLPIFGFPESFSIPGQSNFLGIPISMLVMLLVFIAGAIVLKSTYFGRYFYAIGSNEEAAKLSGINTGKLKILAFGICGFLSALGGVLLLSRTNSGLSSNGSGFEFNVITACVLGGISATGGKGNIFGAIVGVLIVGFLDNGLLLMSVSEYIQLVIKGLLMLLAVIYDTVSRRRSETIKKLKAINIENEL